MSAEDAFSTPLVNTPPYMWELKALASNSVAVCIYFGDTDKRFFKVNAHNNWKDNYDLAEWLLNAARAYYDQMEQR